MEKAAYEGRKLDMKDRRFENKIVVITGGAGGIGKNIARAFGREGGHIIICDVNTKKGRKTQNELRRQKITVDFLCADLSKKGVPRRMVKKIIKRFGRLDILVNNARFGQRISLLDENEDSWEQAMAVTLRAAFFASQEAIRGMSKTGGGNIINISSVAALLTCQPSPVYHIAKAALLQMTRYLAAEAGKHNIRINAVLPGFIVKDEDRPYYESKHNEQYRRIAEFCHPLKKVGSSDDVANAVLFLCSQEASFISGESLIVDGGLTLQEQSSLVFRFNERRKRGFIK